MSLLLCICILHIQNDSTNLTYLSTHREFQQEEQQKKPQPAVECAEEQISNHSKTVYINDSYNLDSIPFDIKNIIDEANTEDSE